MTDMLEKLSKTMAERREELIAQPLARIYPELVLTVLRVLREPDDAQKVIGGLALEEDMFNNCQEGTVFDTAGVCFTAMIDAILKERAGNE